MSVTTTNIIQGPATVYVGVFGVTEPASIATAPGAGWVDCGATQDGIAFATNDDYSEISVDQIIYVAERRRTKRAVTLKTVLAEATLANMALALNNTAPASSIFTPDDGLTAFVPAYGAVLLDGIAPGGFRRRIIIRKTLSIEAVESAWKKDDITKVPVTWAAHWVSASVRPYLITDALV